MELRPWSVCGGAAAPAVAVETDPRAADPAAVAACEDVVSGPSSEGFQSHVE